MEAVGRHCGIGWLRIFAFGLSFLYYIGVFFEPRPWQAKTADPLEWLTIPVL